MEAVANAITVQTRRRVEDGLVASLNALFDRTAGHWRTLGAARARRCQFVVLGAPGRDFHVVVDARGARALRGCDPHAHVVWSSDAATLDAAFDGRVDVRRVRISGDGGALLTLLRGIAGAA